MKSIRLLFFLSITNHSIIRIAKQEHHVRVRRQPDRSPRCRRPPTDAPHRQRSRVRDVRRGRMKARWTTFRRRGRRGRLTDSDRLIWGNDNSCRVRRTNRETCLNEGRFTPFEGIYDLIVTDEWNVQMQCSLQLMTSESKTETVVILFVKKFIGHSILDVVYLRSVHTL